MNTKLTAIAIILAGLGSGCSSSGDIPDLGQVSGRVTYNGEPITGITIIYQSVDGRPSYGRTDNNGNYVMQYNHNSRGVKAGEAHVMFDRLSGEAPGEVSAASMSSNTQPQTTSSLYKKIPQKYFQTFETVTIVPGKNTFDFEVGK